MGRFDGVLICSDLDGTFWGHGAEVENEKAIKYFTENGGRFSFATGRQVDFFYDKPFFSVINAPACLYNGAVVYDYAKKQVLREVRLDYTVREFLDTVSSAMTDVVKFCLYHDAFDIGTIITDLNTVSQEDMDLRSLKLICVFDDVDKALEFKQYCRGLDFFKDTYISRSWGLGVEFNAFDGTKGHALDYIKKHLGNIHTSIGVGDYDNDLTLVRHADIGVAVGNAVDELKKAADWVVKPCAECSIKDLIERLEAAILKGELNEKGDHT